MAKSQEGLLLDLYFMRGVVFERDALAGNDEQPSDFSVEDVLITEERLRREWIDRASIDWLDVLLDLLADPPLRLKHWGRFRFDAACLLGDWMERDPMILARLGELLQVGAAPREDLLHAFAHYGKPPALPSLRDLACRIDELTETEAVALVDAVGGNEAPVEAVRPILQQMQARTPPDRTKVAAELANYLRGKRF